MQSIQYKKYLPASIFIIIVTAAIIIAFLIRDEPHQALHLVTPQQSPHFEDDSDPDSLLRCSENQLNYLKKQPKDTVVQYGKEVYPLYWLVQSTESLIAKLRTNPTNVELNRFLKDNYIVYQAGGRKGLKNRTMLVTGYYEPIFDGSLSKSGQYFTPIYSRPDSLVSTVAEDKKTKLTGRYDDNNKLVEYWNRAEIDKQSLLQGYELAYLRDPFDAFLLHVQGSGRIRLPDGSIKSIHFAASNGLTYNSIGKLLVDEGSMTLEEVNIPAIRQFLQDNPEQQERILHHNPRYIFFSWGDDRGPRGSSGEVLSPGRSVAMDTAALPTGSIGYLVTRRPVVSENGEIADWTAMTRFVFPQDSGAAIKGSGRLDMFWGHGDYAQIAANHMKEEGQLFFLVKKGYSGKAQ